MQRINAGHPRNASPASPFAKSATDATAQHRDVVHLQQGAADRIGNPQAGRIRLDFTKADNALDFEQRKIEAAAA